MSFKQVDADVKPTKICVGTLAGFGDLQHSKRSAYRYEKIEVQGRPNGKNRAMLIWEPEWFGPNFSTKTLNESQRFVYRRNIYNTAKSSILEGLCGYPDAFEQLQQRLSELADYDEATIHATMKQFFQELGPTNFGYVLKQERKKIEGETERILGDYYEIDEIFQLTEKKLNTLAKQTAKINAKIIAGDVSQAGNPYTPMMFTFDPHDYGFDVDRPATTDDLLAQVNEAAA